MLPWPVAFTWWKGKRMKLFRGRTGNSTGAPGEITSLDGGLEVACGKGSLFIEELQLEGGRKMEWEEFSRGHQLTRGERLG